MYCHYSEINVTSFLVFLAAGLVRTLFCSGIAGFETQPSLYHCGGYTKVCKISCFHGNLGADGASVNDKKCKCFVYSGSALIFSS